MKKKLIISYDYELFFGDISGTVQNTLIVPTNAILDAMESVGFKGNFFVDWQMLKYLKEANTKRTTHDLMLIDKQLKDIIRRGHRIELHIHPHWVDAKYNGDGTWNFKNFSHYSLQSFSEEEIIQMFVDGTNLLESIAREVDSQYKIVAFRAGGWAIQPFEKLKKGFERAGIIVDSSASYGIFNTHKNSWYDFRDMPHISAYKYDSDVCKESTDGHFLEVPITSFHMPFALYIHDRQYWKWNCFSTYSDGTHERSDEPLSEGYCKSRLLSRIFDKINPAKRNMLSFTYLSPKALKYIAKHEKGDIHCLIDHPKDVTDVTLQNIVSIKDSYESVFYTDLII